MGKTLDEYSEIAEELIKADEDRDNLFKDIDRIFNIEWSPPDEVAAMPWVYPVRSTDGHDALRAVQRVFSSREPAITVWPHSNEPRDMQQSDELENALRWFMNRAFQSGYGSPLADVIMSAARYDEITGQLTYLPHQRKILEGHGKQVKDERKKRAIDRKLKAMENEGPFGLVVRNPRLVHSRTSEYGLEAVCYSAIWDVNKVIDFYGHSARDLISDKIADRASPYYAVFDVSDYLKRVAFAIPMDNPNTEIRKIEGIQGNDNAIEILDRESELEFIPWLIERGGTSIELTDANKRIPMLYSVVKSDQYEIQNIIHTVLLSEAIAKAAAPRGKKSGPGSEQIDVDYGDPTQDVVLRPGQDYEPLQIPTLDEALFTLSEWIGQKIEKSTVPRVLQGGDVPAQVFSTLNLAVQSGMVTLDPYRKLAERWLAKCANQMLQWVKEDGEKIEAISYSRDNETNAKSVRVYEIVPKNIPEKTLRIDVELQEAVPVDRVQRVNAARMLRELGASQRRTLEEVGETDATGEVERARFERWEEFFSTRFLQRIQRQDELQFQQAQMAMQAQIQMATQQQAQQQAQVQQGQARGRAQPGPQGRRGRRPMARNPQNASPEGEGFSPGDGGTPPGRAAPGPSREQATGETSRGDSF